MLGFLIAVAAGFATPYMEGPVGGPIVKALEGQIAVAHGEQRLITFMVALVIAAVCAALFASGTVFSIIIGAILGYFGTRIFTALRKVIEARPDSD